MRPSLLFVFLLTVSVHATIAHAALDLTLRNVGVSLGNSPRVIGIRINAVDSDVQRVDGLNLTLWNPRPSPRASFNGLALGLIGPKAARLQGISLGGIGATGSERIRGLAIGGFGAGTHRLGGIVAGGILTETKGDSWGLMTSAVACRAHARFDGIAFGGVFANADRVRGASLGGFAALGGGVDGLALSGGVVGIEGRLRGVAVGGIFAGAENLYGIASSLGGVGANERFAGIGVGGLAVISGGTLRGIAVSAGVTGAGDSLDGIALGGFGVGAGQRLRGLAVGGLVSMAPEVSGITFGALNGVIIESINLEDFLEIRHVNQRYTGLSIGLVNYSAELKGVQLGLFNYAGNNPRWLRLLPFVNAHF